MGTGNDLPDLATLAIEATKTLTKEMYKDLGQPIASRIGRVLGGVLDIAFLPVLFLSMPASKAVLTLKSNFESFAKRLSQVEEGQLQVPPNEIAVPILQRLTYVSDSDLRDMFVELLAKASDASEASTAHPSFVHVIENISPDEARIIQHLHDKHDIPFLKARMMFNAHEGIDVAPMLTGIEEEVRPLVIKNIPLYFANFEGLGLVTKGEGSLSDTDHWYSHLIALYKPLVAELYARGHTNGKKYPIALENRFWTITAYGHLFVKACLKKTE